jgi:hypothetical protein
MKYSGQDLVRYKEGDLVIATLPDIIGLVRPESRWFIGIVLYSYDIDYDFSSCVDVYIKGKVYSMFQNEISLIQAYESFKKK